MDWSFTTGLLIGMFIGWFVEYLIDLFFWRRGNSSDVQEVRLRLRDAEVELSTARLHLRSTQSALQSAEERNEALEAAVRSANAEISMMRELGDSDTSDASEVDSLL